MRPIPCLLSNSTFASSTVICQEVDVKRVHAFRGDTMFYTLCLTDDGMKIGVVMNGTLEVMHCIDCWRWKWHLDEV